MDDAHCDSMSCRAAPRQMPHRGLFLDRIVAGSNGQGGKGYSRLDITMNKAQFIAHIGDTFRAEILSFLMQVMREPPGSPPHPRRVDISRFTQRLSTADQRYVELIAEECVDTAIQQLLFMLDNIRDFDKKGGVHLELRNAVDGMILNDPKGGRLCELYGKHLLDTGKAKLSRHIARASHAEAQSTTRARVLSNQTVNDIIDALAAFEPTDDGFDNDLRLADIFGGFRTFENRDRAMAAIFSLLERYPNAEFGTPGTLVHELEAMPGRPHVPLLRESLHRQPTGLTVWMANRLLTSDLPQEERVLWLAELEAVLRHPLASGDTRQCADMFLAPQRSRRKGTGGPAKP